MNRIKVLLTAVGVLTIVGSALAYSGRGPSTICYVPRPTGGCSTNPSCTTLKTATINTSGNTVCYEIVQSGTDCSTVTCSTPASITID
jgi:oxalate decarboxylase/phosphoglucose isomerase-like protein (cupin superfamily)